MAFLASDHTASLLGVSEQIMPYTHQQHVDNTSIMQIHARRPFEMSARLPAFFAQTLLVHSKQMSTQHE